MRCAPCGCPSFNGAPQTSQTPPDTYVLIAWSNYYGDNGQIVTESTLRYALAGQFYFEPDEDESYEPGYYWHDEDDNEYDGDVVAWHLLPLFKAEK